MRKRSSKKKRGDLNVMAAEVVEEAIDPKGKAKKSAEEPKPEDQGKNPAAVQLGRLGGLKGGPARAKKLTKKQRSEAARKAALARWRKENK
jgi:hypothetical protein